MSIRRIILFFVFSVGNQACATSTVNDPFCSILQATRTLPTSLGEISHCLKHSTFHREWIICVYSSLEGLYVQSLVQNQQLMRLCLDHFLTWCTRLFDNRVGMSSSCSTAACDTPWILKSIYFRFHLSLVRNLVALYWFHDDDLRVELAKHPSK